MISPTQAQRKVVADLMPKVADRLKLDEKNPRTLSFTAKELGSIREGAEAARPHAQHGMIRNSLRHVVDAVNKALEEVEGIGWIPKSRRLYQFKITLLESQPPICRRIQVKDSTLDKFHERIQTAMGWTNSHLHRFRIEGERYGDPELLGDGWQHEVLFEGCLRAEKGGRYPVCVDGELACPPEDVGGVWGYAEFLEAIANPDDDEHERMLEWSGGRFDPEDFDAKEATKAMRRGLPDWRE